MINDSPAWKTGDCCAVRGIHSGRVLYAQPVIVVRDSPAEVALLLLPGANCRIPAGWRFGSHGHGAASRRWASIRAGDWKLADFTWHTNRLLILLEPGRFYATIYFWEHVPNSFECYYINFQLPFRRSHAGFDTLDLELDMVIDGTGAWHWKDLDDYEEAIQEGGILPEWMQAIERDKAEVFDRLRQHRYPLDGSWLRWQPDPGWSAPLLPPGWEQA